MLTRALREDKQNCFIINLPSHLTAKMRAKLKIVDKIGLQIENTRLY